MALVPRSRASNALVARRAAARIKPSLGIFEATSALNPGAKEGIRRQVENALNAYACASARRELAIWRCASVVLILALLVLWETARWQRNVLTSSASSQASIGVMPDVNVVYPAGLVMVLFILCFAGLLSAFGIRFLRTLVGAYAAVMVVLSLVFALAAMINSHAIGTAGEFAPLVVGAIAGTIWSALYFGGLLVLIQSSSARKSSGADLTGELAFTLLDSLSYVDPDPCRGVSEEDVWNDFNSKRALLNNLEQLASAFEIRYVDQLSSFNGLANAALERSAPRFADAYRMLGDWILTPQSQTRLDLRDRLGRDLRFIALGHWDYLQRAERPVPTSSRRMRELAERLGALAGCCLGV
ncbi:MAG: hypothetical protein J2P54_20790, partial [Bradyrhizobiaceae bacterium]|nr:hypothetical protein [Bradyrhizobiaceae bacterium]